MKLQIRKSTTRFLSVILVLAIVISGFSPVFSAPENPESFSSRIKSKFSQKTDKALSALATQIDKALLDIAQRLDKTRHINLKVDSHFYDQKIRRYFISFRGAGTFGGKLPFNLVSKQYYLTSNSVIAHDLTIEKIQKKGRFIVFQFHGCLVISLDQLVYELARAIPDLAATLALSKAAELLTEFFSRLNTGIIVEAASNTITDFSAVAISEAGAKVIQGASNNKNVTKLVKSSIKDGSMLSFLALAILKCSVTSIVSLTGASLGSAVGSALCPGVGSVVGAYLGSKILRMLARTIVYTLTVKVPLYNSLRCINKYYRIYKANPKDVAAAKKLDKHTNRILKLVGREFDQSKFKIFRTVLKRIDKYDAEDRYSFVGLLKNFQQILLFKVIDDKDWYFAKYYHQLKTMVEKWQLDHLIVFTTNPPQRPAR